MYINEDDAPNYEKDNMDKKASDITVIFHSRKKFYNGKLIYWYEFMGQDDYDFDNLIPRSFLNVPLTVLYEYGGTHEEALKELTNAGFIDIIEGNEL
jgi:hypothetical protein